MQRVYSPFKLPSDTTKLSLKAPFHFDLQLIHPELGTHYTYLNSHDPTPFSPSVLGMQLKAPCILSKCSSALGFTFWKLKH